MNNSLVTNKTCFNCALAIWALTLLAALIDSIMKGQMRLTKESYRN